MGRWIISWYISLYSPLVFVFVFFFHCTIWENIGKVLRASNSDLNCPIWPKLERIWGFMPFLNFLKFQEEPEKMNEVSPEQQYLWQTIHTVMDTSNSIGDALNFSKSRYRDKTYTNMYITLYNCLASNTGRGSPGLPLRSLIYGPKTRPEEKERRARRSQRL